jgi:hypothetical protein
MVWSDRDTVQKVRQQRLFTLGGNQLVYSGAITSGINITLEASTDTGWLTGDQVADVRALAEVPGATYALDYHGQTFTVIFRHDDPPAFEAQALVFRPNQEDTDYYTAVIKLVTV